MGSDIARVSYDAGRNYSSVVMQQGRVFVEADWNEQQEIAGEALRADVLDIVGPAGTPDNGYEILFPTSPKLPKDYDFTIGAGAMYVGGVRVSLPKSSTYFTQPDWLNPAPPPVSPPQREYILLHLSEQDVSAVEDHALKDRALGGPDTAQRRRIVQHIERYDTQAQKCDDALKELEAKWQAEGRTFDPATMRLTPTAKLQVSFAGAGPIDLCEPAAEGGYLDADNQMIRVKIVDSTHILWGYDDASTLYRVDVDTTTSLILKSRPVDAYHNPRKDQAVEVLLSTAALDTALGDYIAKSDGFVTTLSGDYDPNLQRVSLTDALTDPDFKTGTGKPPVFLRMWNGIAAFTPGVAVNLGATGVQVTLQDGPYHAGEFWMFAVRPSTPQTVYPERYLAAPQPPDGPREWVCPLAVISWKETDGSLLADCRNPFDNLVDLTKRKASSCCTVVVEPKDVTESNSLQAIIDKYQSKAEYATICLMPGHYHLWEPLRLGIKHSNLTIEACRGGVILQAAPNTEIKFLDGLIVLTEAYQVTLRGLTLNMPKVPLAQFQGKFVGLNASAGKKVADAVFNTLYASIGVRSIHCARLTVRDCFFRYAEAQNEDIFAAAIFAGGVSVGLNISNNLFQSNERLSRSDRPLQILVGYLHLPILTIKKHAKRVGSPIKSMLDGASFHGNQFSGLTAATLIAAETGDLRIEDNRVQKSASGFWLFSLVALAQVEAIGNESAYAKMYSQSSAPAQGALDILRLVSQEALIKYGAELGQAYPLPSEYTVNRTAEQVVPAGAVPVSVVPAAVEPPAIQPTNIKEIVQKLFSFHLTKEAGAPAPAVPVDQTKTQLSDAAAGVNPAQFEHSATIPGKATLGLSLTVIGNHVSALLDTNKDTSVALFVFDDPQDTASALTMTANTFENLALKSATAIIAFVEHVAVTGNLIFNDAASDFARSLILFPGGTTSTPAIAVTGNVFRNQAFLPTRPFMPPPLDEWRVLNTQI